MGTPTPRFQSGVPTSQWEAAGKLERPGEIVGPLKLEAGHWGTWGTVDCHLFACCRLPATLSRTPQRQRRFQIGGHPLPRRRRWRLDALLPR